MTLSNLGEMIQFTEFKNGSKSKLYGQIEGFPVEIKNSQNNMLGYAFIFSCSSPLDKNQIKQGNRIFKEEPNLKKKASMALASADSTAMAGTYFAVYLKLPSGKETEVYEAFLRAIGTFIREERLTPPEQCCFCGSGNCDKIAHIDGRLQPVHSQCHVRWIDDQKVVTEQKEERSSYLLGLIGGLIGGLVAIIPTLLTIFFFNTQYGALYFLIPIGIYYGWSKLGGKLSKVTTVFTIIYSLAQVFIIDIVYTYINLKIQYPDKSLSPINIVAFMLRGSNYVDYYLQDSIFALLFIAIGIGVSWKRITRTHKTDLIQNETALQESIAKKPGIYQ